MSQIVDSLGQIFTLIDNSLQNINAGNLASNKVDELIQKIPYLSPGDKITLQNYALQLSKKGQTALSERISKAFENKGKDENHILPQQHNQPINNVRVDNYPILNASTSFVPKQNISPSSIQLDFRSDRTFKGFVKSSNLIQAKVEVHSINLDYFERKIKQLKNEFRHYFIQHFELMTRVEAAYNFTIRIKPLPSDKITSTEVLVEQLNLTEKNTNHYTILQNLAERVFDLGKNRAFREVGNLAHANNEYLTKKLLEHLIQSLNTESLYSIELLKSLRSTLIDSTTETLKEILTLTELTRILNTVQGQIAKIEKEDVETTFLALSTFSDILDVMGDANVIEIEEGKMRKSLIDMLNQYSKHKDLFIHSQAHYALQALIRIPSSSSTLRRGKALISGFASLYKMVANKDLTHLVDVYKSFKEALESEKDRENWYHDMRFLKLLAFTGDLGEFQKEIQFEMKNTAQDVVAGNVLIILNELFHHSKMEWRKAALNLMKDLFINDKRWGSDKDTKTAILNKLLECTSLHDEETALAARRILGTLTAEQHLPSFQKKLIDKMIVPPLSLEKKPVPAPTNPLDLLSEAKNMSYVNLEQRIYQMKENFLDERIQDSWELVTYIKASGSTDAFDPSNKPFDLHSKGVEPFLKGNDTVFLLLGDSGSGKSKYLQFLHKELWQDWDRNAPIPLLIDLNAVGMPFDEIINKALKSYGFSSGDCENLRNTRSFIFLLDGYDELRIQQNVYSLLGLGNWNAKVIVTCRTQYLLNNMSDYQRFFIPNNNAKLHQAVISPLSEGQIKDYCDEVLASQEMNQNLLSFLNQHAGLKEMCRNPLFLRLLLNVLPEVQANFENMFGSKNQYLIHLSILDAFIERFFKEQEKSLLNVPASLGDVKKKFGQFSREIALEMIKSEGNLSLNREEIMGILGHDPLLFSGIPLRKGGEDVYTFKHKTLMEYFIVRSIISIAFEISEDHLRKVLLTKESDIIKFLAEMMNSAPDKTELENRFLEIILTSRTDLSDAAEIAAANAITILNAAGYHFSKLDFSGIRIKGAYLARAILHQTNFTGADLRNVTMYEAFLADALLTGCQMEGVDFGQRPYLIHEESVNAMATSQNSDRVLSISGKTACLWDLKSCRKLLSFKHSDLFREIVFSSNGLQAFLRDSKGNILLWDLETNKMSYPLGMNRNLFSCMAFSTVNGYAIFGNTKMEEGAFIWDIEENRALKFITIFDGIQAVPITSVAISGINQKALLGCANGTVWLWDFNLNPNFSNNLRQLVEKNDDLEEKKYEFREENSGENDEKKGDRPPPSLVINSVAFSQTNEDEAISGSSKGIIRIWDLQTCQEKLRLVHPEGVKSVILSHTKAISGGCDGVVRLWDIQTGRELQNFIGHNDEICSVAFTQDSNWILSCSKDKTIRHWNINRKATPLRSGEIEGLERYFEFSKDGKALLLNQGKIVESIDLETGERVSPSPIVNVRNDDTYRTRIIGNIIFLSFSKNNKNHTFSLKGHTGAIYDVAYSSSNNYLLSASADKTVRLWDLNSRKELFCFPHSHQVLNVQFLPNLRCFVSGDTQPSIKLWQIRDGQDNLAPLLLKSSSGSLVAQNINLKKVIGLSDENRLLLEILQNDINFDKWGLCNIL